MLDVFCGGSQKSSELWQTGNKTYDVYAIQDEAVWATITVRLDGEVRSGQNPRNILAVSVLPDYPTAAAGLWTRPIRSHRTGGCWEGEGCPTRLRQNGALCASISEGSERRHRRVSLHLRVQDLLVELVNKMDHSTKTGKFKLMRSQGSGDQIQFADGDVWVHRTKVRRADMTRKRRE